MELGEIQAARQPIFSRHPKADVASRYSKWGGIPRYVLQNTDAADQDLLQIALNCCSLDNVTHFGSISRASGFTLLPPAPDGGSGLPGGPCGVRIRLGAGRGYQQVSELQAR